MDIKNLAMLSAFSFLLSSSSAYCSTAYIVTLSNGNVLETNSYSIKDGKVYLKYPVGEAAVPARQVVSIKADDGSMELLQSEGIFVPHAEPVKAVQPPTNPAPVAEAFPDNRPSGPHSGHDNVGPNRPGGGNAINRAMADASQPTPDSQRGVTVPGGGFGGDGGGDPRINSLIEQSFNATDEAQKAQIDDALQKLLDAEENQAINTGN